MCGCEQGTCPGNCPCGCRHTPPLDVRLTPTMTDLLDGTTVPWHFVSGKTEPGTQPNPLVLQRVRERRQAATALPPPVVRQPQTKRLVDGGLFIAAALAEQMRRLK